MKTLYEELGRRFVRMAICDWGQSNEKRIQPVQAVLDAAGFKATATCWPVFGGIWPKACEGPDGPAATAWLRELTDTMQRGEFYAEAAHVSKAIELRQHGRLGSEAATEQLKTDIVIGLHS